MAKNPITPPTKELTLTPSRHITPGSIITLLVFLIGGIALAIIFHPLAIIIAILPLIGFIVTQMSAAKSSIKVTTEKLETVGSMQFNKTILFKDVYKVVKVNPLVILGQAGGSNLAIVFLDKNGEILFFIWVDYSNKDLETLFNLFEPRDRLELGRSTSKELKQAFGQQ